MTRRERIEHEMDEELRFHIDACVEDLVRGGMPRQEAARRAHAEFGGVEARKEECRDALGLRLLDELGADVRYAWRQCRRSPGFTAVAILSLALGIGANSAIFGMMEAAMWRPIAAHEPDRLAMFSWVSGPRPIMSSTSGNWARTPAGGRAGTFFSYPIVEAFRRQTQLFDVVFAFKPIGRVTVIAGGEAEMVGAHLVSGDFYRGVGVVPIAGRAIGPQDDVRGGTETVAVISDGYWAGRFGRSPSAVGAQIRVNQIPVTIIGVNPPGFSGVDPGDRPDLLMPLHTQPLVFPSRRTPNGSLLDTPDTWWLLPMGRLKPGITHAEAEAALEVTLQQAIAATMPAQPDRDRVRFRLLPGSRGQDNLRELFGRPLYVLGGLVGVVLLIACANVANLLLARASTRRRELSLRLALGAGRWRIARQLLTEGLALGLAGGAVGLLLAYWLRDAIPGLLHPPWASELQFTSEFGARVLILTIVVTIATTVVASLAPIWQSLRVEINAALKDGGRAVPGAGTALRGRALVVFQVALSVVILVGAGLFVRSLYNLRSVTLGFRPERVLLFTVDPPRVRYAGAARKAFFERLDEAVGAIPGVEAASLSQSALLSGGSSQTMVGLGSRPDGSRELTYVNDVGRRFFDTMGIPIVAGRSFDARDRAASPPVVVVNQRFVKEFFPNESPIGKTLENGALLFEIVGVCGDTPFGRLRAPVPPTLYRHFAQTANEPGQMTFAVRSASTESAIVTSVRAAVRAVDKDLPIVDVRTQTQQIDAMLARERLFVALSSGFGLVALALAAIGIYGMIAHGVARRTGEIGVRLALGAGRRTVLGMILRESTSLTGLGVVAGIAAALALGRFVATLLFGVARTDPATIAAAALAMLAVATAAAWIPARRASRLDPVVALRHE